MARLFAHWIDNGTMIIAAVLLLRFYYKPEAKRLYKKTWVLLVCVFLILYNAVDLGLAYRHHITSRLPSRESVEETIQSSGQFVPEDFVFSSRDGYQLLIPAGYTYVSSQPGGLSLTATRDHSAFLVFKTQDSSSLDKLMNGTLLALGKKNATFKLDDRRNIRIDDTNAVRIDFSVLKNNVPAKAILVLCRKGDTLFQLTLSCPRDLFSEMKPEYEAILTSFKIG
jgi:hypothetical protein